MQFRNKKNHKVYTVLNIDKKVVDATNATEGREMVLYINEENEFFVREKTEFMEKFVQL